MPTTYDGTTLEPIQTTVTRLPDPADNLPTVTVTARFDWKFWILSAIAAYAIYSLLSSKSKI